MLRRLREARGLTQGKLGELAGGMTPQTVNKYERGVSEPMWSVVLRLADALGVQPGEFREPADAQEPTGDGPPAEPDAADRRPAGKRK